MSVRSGEQQQVRFGLAELSERSGVAVRTIRFYTSEGLLAAPGKQGRVAVYTSQHMATLELIRKLQEHGFGLAAIKDHLLRLPEDASDTSIAMHSTMLAPWLADRPSMMSRTELDTRTDRLLSDEDITMLEDLGVIQQLPEDNGATRYAVATALLSIGVELIDYGLSTETSAEITETIAAAGQRLTAELEETYSRRLKPKLAEQNVTDDDVERFVSLFKPISVAALARSYEQALAAMRQRESEDTQARQQARAEAHDSTT